MAEVLKPVTILEHHKNRNRNSLELTWETTRVADEDYDGEEDAGKAAGNAENTEIEVVVKVEAEVADTTLSTKLPVASPTPPASARSSLPPFLTRGGGDCLLSWSWSFPPCWDIVEKIHKSET